MEFAEVAGLVLAAVAVLATYHVAKRAGTFARPELEVTAGSTSPRAKGEATPSGFVYGVPLEPVDRYLIEWPIHLQNIGEAPISNVTVQISYDRTLSTLYPHPDSGEQHGVSRRVLNADEFVSVTYDVGDLQLDGSAVLPDFVYFDPGRATSGEPAKYALTYVRYIVRAANIREQAGGFWFVCITSESFDELVSSFGSFIKPLFELEVQDRFAATYLTSEAEPVSWHTVLCQLSQSHRGDGVHRLAFDHSQIAQLGLARKDPAA